MSEFLEEIVEVLGLMDLDRGTGSQSVVNALMLVRPGLDRDANGLVPKGLHGRNSRP